MCPIVQSAPITVGVDPLPPSASLSTWITVPSWTLVLAPIDIDATSPRIVQLYQTDASSATSTAPTIDALGATKAAAAVSGTLSPSA